MRSHPYSLMFRHARLAQGVSVRSFACQLGVSAAFLSRIENGVRQPSPETLSKLIEIAEVPLTELYLKARFKS